MKRSKFFLSVTTCLLGVAAFAAVKANRHQVTGCTAGTGRVVVSCATVNSLPSGHTPVICTSGTKTVRTCSNNKTLYTLAG